MSDTSVIKSGLTLAAIGVSADDAASSMRVSFGITNRIEEVDRLIEVLRVEVPALADRLGSAK